MNESEDHDQRAGSAYPPSIQAGIPKLGPKPEGWHRVSLGELLRVVERPAKLVDTTVYQLVTAKRGRGGIVPREQLLGSKILTKTQYFVDTGDFVISNRQISHGACGLVPESLKGAIVSNEYTVIHPSKLIDQLYLGYLSYSIYFQQTCFHSSIGVHVEKLVFRLDNWFKWEIDVPSLAEQRRIVSVLEALDQAIVTVERLITAKRRRKTGVIGHLLFDTTARRGFISDLAEVNPRGQAIAPETTVSFVGMDDVSEHGRLTRTRESRRGNLGAGYTAFAEGDILVAKITPCFENGKGALAHGLINGVGLGSTEFHVVRPFDSADAAYLHQITLTRSFRTAGERQMTGSAGQKRIPAEFIEDFPIFVLGENARRTAGALLSAIDAESERHEAALAKFRTQKRVLLQKLLTGEWRLDERFDAAALRPGIAETAP